MLASAALDGSDWARRALADAPSADDEALAVRIREAGRRRVERREPVDLVDFLRAIPNLERRRAPLDAAIDVALRAGARAERLIELHPSLASAVRDAEALALALGDPEDADCRPALDERSLPADFGPALEDGAARYRLLERVGAGASGEVFRAVDRRLSETGRPAIVAIKVRSAPLAGPVARSRFEEEAARGRSLEHPNVVRVYDMGEAPTGEPYIVQEFVGGGNLHRWVESRRGGASARDAVGVVVRLARAAQAAHARGLAHLDIKPSNVLLSDAGEPKLADFGLAVCAAQTGPRAGARSGTLAFMSPEQFFGAGDGAAPPADVYALGGVLHWLLTGDLPGGDDAAQIAATHRSGRARIASLRGARARGRVDGDLEAICLRALAPDRSERYDAAGTLADDLEAWLRREPIRWTNPTSLKRLRLFARRRPTTLALIVCLTLALLGGATAAETARHYAASARARAIEARAQARLLEAERRWKAETAEDLARLMRGLTHARRTGLAGEVLTSLWMLEWIHGPELLADPDDLPRLWSARIDVLRRLLAQRRAESGATSFEALQLESLLAFWLVKGGGSDEPAALLAHAIAHWRDRLDPADPWLADLKAMRLCAEVNGLGARDEPLGGDARAVAIRVERALRAHDERLAARDDGGPLRLLIVERLATLYGPGLLDSPPWRRWAQGQARTLGLSTPAR